MPLFLVHHPTNACRQNVHLRKPLELRVAVRSSPWLTFVRHHLPGLQIHPGAPLVSHFVDVVAQGVAAVLAAAQAEPLVEGFLGVAAVCHARLLLVQQRIDEQVDGAFMGAFHDLVHIYK